MFYERKIRLAVLMDEAMYRRTFHNDDLDFLASFAEIINQPPYPDKIDQTCMIDNLRDAEACFTCWGTPVLTKEILDAAPDLKLVLHGAGTPKAIVSDEIWTRGIRVATAAPVIAIDVAEGQAADIAKGPEDNRCQLGIGGEVLQEHDARGEEGRECNPGEDHHLGRCPFQVRD